MSNNYYVLNAPFGLVWHCFAKRDPCTTGRQTVSQIYQKTDIQIKGLDITFINCCNSVLFIYLQSVGSMTGFGQQNVGFARKYYHKMCNDMQTSNVNAWCRHYVY